MVIKSSMPASYNSYTTYKIKSSKDITEDFISFLIRNDWIDDYHFWLHIWYECFEEMKKENEWTHIYALYNSYFHDVIITYKPRNKNTLKLISEKFEKILEKVLKEDPSIVERKIKVCT